MEYNGEEISENEWGQAEEDYAEDDMDEFPLECVKHLASCSCNCQQSGPDVTHNKHVRSCMVGKAQKYLGIKVAEKPLYSGINN